MTAHKTYTISRTNRLAIFEQRLAEVDRMNAGYRAMMKVAVEFQMEAEIERIDQAMCEWFAEGDVVIGEAIDAGFDPEDFDA